MKVLLIYPPFLNKRVSSDDVASVPIGLYHVAAVLRDAGRDAQVANWHTSNLDMIKAVETVESFGPAVVGFSIVNGNRFGALDMAAMLKERNPNLTIVLGGIGATFLWEHFLTHFPQVDYAVVGEGEEAMASLVKCLEIGDTRGIAEIPGVASRVNGAPVLTEQKGYIKDIDALPRPSRFYKFQHLSLSRGCPHNCTFCGSPKFWGRTMRFHSADYFVRQLHTLAKSGEKFFYVSDDTFTLKKDLVITVCKEIIAAGLDISWNAISRVDRVDEDILYWMRKAGCIQISYGVESGCETTRDMLNKNMSTQDILRAFELTARFGILSRAYFIYGCQGEGPEVLQANLDLMDAIQPLGAVFYILDMFPGTKLYEEYLQKNNLTDDIWLERVEDIMYWETDPALTQELIEETGDALRNHFYRNLPDYVYSLQLENHPDLTLEHGDFFSRLGMTFTAGDYANDSRIPNASGVAEFLFEKALTFAQDPRAYLGLGLLRQKSGQFEKALGILEKALELFPNNEQIRLCLGTNLMNLGAFGQALKHFDSMPHLPGAAKYAEQCRACIAGSYR